MNDARIAALVATVEAWQDPEHPPRAAAAKRALSVNALYTAENVAFAVNAAMHAVTRDALAAWAETASEFERVGVWTDDVAPLPAWPDVLAALVSAEALTVRLPDTAFELLPAFLDAVRRADPSLSVLYDWGDAPAPDAVLASGSSEAMEDLAAWCDAHGIGPAQRRLQPAPLVVGVLDAQASPDERIGFAEDALLFAESPRRLRLLWAPADHSPDPFLDACAGFRELFPAAPSLEGRLQMPRAFLASADTPHAWGDGFLVSKGDPEPQPTAHLRWTEYETFDALRVWLEGQDDVLLVAPPRVQNQLRWEGPALPPGEVHRERLGTNPLTLIRP